MENILKIRKKIKKIKKNNLKIVENLKLVTMFNLLKIMLNLFNSFKMKMKILKIEIEILLLFLKYNFFGGKLYPELFTEK